MSDLSKIKVLGKITLPESKVQRIQCAYCGTKNVKPYHPDAHYCRNQSCVEEAEKVRHKPIDHSGTCSSCGGHSYYGYCENCDNLF